MLVVLTLHSKLCYDYMSVLFKLRWVEHLVLIGLFAPLRLVLLVHLGSLVQEGLLVPLKRLVHLGQLVHVGPLVQMGLLVPLVHFA